MQQIIKTILEDDLEKLLISLGLKDLLDSAQLKCSHCKKILKKVDIFGVYPLSGDIKVSCNLPQCIEKTIDQTQKK